MISENGCLRLDLEENVSRSTASGVNCIKREIPSKCGANQIVKAGDMMISDQAGIILDIIYGPDQRTQIAASTRNMVFTSMCPLELISG